MQNIVSRPSPKHSLKYYYYSLLHVDVLSPSLPSPAWTHWALSLCLLMATLVPRVPSRLNCIAGGVRAGGGGAQVTDLYDPRTQWASYVVNAIKVTRARVM